ncbi:ABC transporter permease [Siphonobacter sp. SORGH_AS_1065]|uniref:ABC transporter permease n=1 Tax=Siphonobacter sp. SORGH_AS_1065 TaxID=3041795 RepID=UPI00278A45C3|nr:ABC transporter permease [Siphonobacter sp. SORGH_AS_1065]MDQ1085837.1 putative ABC transport system permease protein [Siphonobacter sp. SORGH_AS_1065]
MLRNYFIVAWRNLVRNRAFTLINITGLALGLATCLLIMLFVTDELSYDRFHEKADRIVRVVFRGNTQGGAIKDAHVMPPTARTLRSTFPEVEQATRFRMAGKPFVSYGNKSLRESVLVYADSNIFQVFTLPLLKGNPKTALIKPSSIVISETVARKYFGEADPVGKVLEIKDWKSSFQVTGVMQDIPENSHVHFDMLASMAGLAEAQSNSWMTSEFFTYLVLREGSDYKKLEAKLPKVVASKLGPQLEKAFGMSYADFWKKGNSVGLFLQPITDIHLHSDFPYDLSAPGNAQTVYIAGAIALLMLLVACINFMNLSSAGASKRAREVGIRKVLGSAQSELMRQFLFESILLTGIALFLALWMVDLALPAFNQLSGKHLGIPLLINPLVLLGLVLLVVVVGLLAGSYPAFFLSSFKPLSVLKGGGNTIKMGQGSLSFRNGLVVFQFFISIALMICTTVVYRQLSFIEHKELGYQKEEVIILPETWALHQNQAAFRQRLSGDSRIQSISSSEFIPAGPSSNNNFFVAPDRNPDLLVKTLRYDVDPQYIPTLGIQVVEGRNFSEKFATDSSGIILNEAAVRSLGWKGNVLGRTVTSRENNGIATTYRVIGVVKDFHFRSLHELITPLVMIQNSQAGNLIIKTKTRDLAGLLQTMQREWNRYPSEVPFSYSFLNDRFSNTYQEEQKTGTILSIFAGLTIFVACLGLFGLATFTAQQRTKEIGVRKVLGASTGSILALLSRDFLKLVGIAFLMAIPLAWYAMNEWLQDFAYRISLEWWVFAVAGLLAIAIALITVSFQSVKAALVNPVKSLKSE